METSNIDFNVIDNSLSEVRHREEKDTTKLLLVEDDQDFSSALSLRLAKRDFEITRVFTAEDALDKLEEINPHVIVADIKLPGMDGMQFLAAVRKIDKCLPVVLVTGYASLESAKEAVRLNAADYLLKPLENIDELLNPVYKAVHSYKLTCENRKLLDRLRIKIEELKHQKVSLEEKNIALREILEQIEIEKKRIKDDISVNINELILPLVKKIKKRMPSIGAKYIDILSRNLDEIASSFGRKVTNDNFKLTPREIEICDMIRSGLSSKDISKLINVSCSTIERHRNNIRKKLGMVNQNVNLTSYLQSK